MRNTYYQPERNGETPEELWDFQVFKNKETAMDWLWQHGYDADEWNIVEYHDDDIEDPTFIDEYGDEEYLLIEDEEDFEELIIDEVVSLNGSVDNLIGENIRQTGESGQEWRDRLWEIASDEVASAIESIENSDNYNLPSHWSDKVRDTAIRRVCDIITGVEVW